MLFSEIGLGPDVLRAIEDKGYTQPTPIQEQAIPWVLRGRDVLGCAQTGTGKTASFTLPMIDILAAGRARARMPRSLILEPTRELAAQVAESFETYGRYHKLSMALLIGGETFTEQVKRLDRGVDVLIATPGRLLDLFERGNIMLNDIKVFVIDEADRMLDMGFIPDIERIVAKLPKIRQTLFFSATMPPEIRRLADAFLMNPKEVTVAPPASPAETVTQALCIVHPEDKRNALRHLLRTEDVRNAFIFCNRKRDIGVLQKSLERHGFNAGALHGDMVQSKRTETLEEFKQGKITLLVCSDVAARGLDVQGLSHVFNFDVPINAEDYVHRIGRTGRAGRSGRAFTIATPEDGKLVGAIARLIGREIPLIAIDGLETPGFEDEDTVRSRRGRGRGKPKDEARESREARPSRSRGERDRSERERPERERAERGPERERPEAETALPPRSEGPPRRERDRRRRRDEDDDDDSPVIGFGDHLPAFMLAPTRMRSAPESESNQEG
ncbi:DEAD/DEAH box helicase [Azospirillum halopraeferens]|uniref:DEAD/DEAH box helicase n=1 Tax=Azospirillum halopraeferens TaxID=34010 RepID=UPI00048BDA65|nr:DEAD/DEAH box helicase [Azospirillum halopraeferens]